MRMIEPLSVEPARSPLISFELTRDFTVNFSVSMPLVIIAMLLIVFGVWGLSYVMHRLRFEFDSAEFGLENAKVTLRPNDTDRQIAYQIWVELSTRKIGLPIDLEHDVIAEVYDSWYSFFSITRELLKDVPVRKFRRTDTAKIIDLTIAVLNDGLRPHLTKWQARYRRWYEPAFRREEHIDLSPQEVQRGYPKYTELEAELLEVNKNLIAYRQQMKRLIE